MAQINFGLLNTDIPAQIGAMPANALAMRRQRIQQDEDRAGQVEARQMQNALTRMQMQKGQREFDAEDRWNTEVGTHGISEESLPRLMKADPVRGMAAQKSLTDQQKAVIEMRKSMGQLEEQRIKSYREQLPMIQTPEQLEQWFVEQRNDPDLAQVKWPTTLEQTLQQAREASQSPQGFGQFKLNVARGLSGFLEMNKPTDFERTLDLAGMSPEQKRAAAAARVSKETTHAPAASINNYGQPVSAVDQQGNPVLVQFSKDGTPKVAPFAPYNANTADATRKKEAGAKTALELLNEAEQWVGEATGSNLGAARDAAGRVVGASSKASEAAARLSTLQGALMMAQPRMEGPQSNLDVQLYERMAGRIGDPTVPAAEKRAAMDTIRSLHQKYVDGAQRGRSPAAAPQKSSAFDSMPNPAQYTGKAITDTSTGVRYRSNGSQWVRE